MKQYSNQQMPLPEKSASLSSFRNRFLALLLFFIFISFSIFLWDFSRSMSSTPTLWNHCSAKTVLSNPPTSIENAETIRRNIRYETVITTDTFHYYCLLGQERTGDIKIEITSHQSLSLYFQLYDPKGKPCPPSNYIFDPVNHILQIRYHIQANKNYLLGLHNSSKDTASYTIHYQEIKKNTENKSKSNTTSKPAKKNITKKKTTLQLKTTSKPKSTPNSRASSRPRITTKPMDATKTKTVSKPKTTTKPKGTTKAKTVSKPKATSKPRVAVQPKRTNPLTVPQLVLSNSFIQIKAKNSFSIRAVITPRQTSSLQWSVSSDTFLKEKRIKRTTSGGTFSATTVKKGTLIVTCRVKGKKNLSASCTIKIT